MDKRIINCITCKHWVSQDSFGAYYNCELTPLRPESNLIRECENYEEKMNDISQTQQTLDQMTEQNKHIKRDYDNTIEIEEDYLVELLETINNLCEANKILQDKFELSQKLVSVLQEKLRLF